MDAVTSANTEFLDQFHGNMNGFVSTNAAACFQMSGATKKATVNGRQVANPCAKSHFAIQLDDDLIIYQQPAFDPATAVKNDTITWQNAIYDACEHIGRNAFMLITPDFKRRLWPYARTGIIGKRTPVYILNKKYNFDGQFYLDWIHLKYMLDVVAPLVGMGYSKTAILDNLILSARSTLEKVGQLVLEQTSSESSSEYKQRCYEWARSHAWKHEKELKQLRNNTEFTVAVMVASRTLSDKDREKAQKERAKKLAKENA